MIVTLMRKMYLMVMGLCDNLKLQKKKVEKSFIRLCIVISQSSDAFGPDKQLHEGSGFPSQFAIAALSGSTQTTVKNTKENGLSKM